MKWAIVLAGVSDFFRPAEKLSLTQNLAITATGMIWTRWCFIIKPKNYLYVGNPFLSPGVKLFLLSGPVVSSIQGLILSVLPSGWTG